MTVRYAESHEVANWNTHVNANPDGGNILQGTEFIEQKVLAGWRARFVMIDDRAVAFLEKTIPLLGKVWYCPKGPSTLSKADLAELLTEIKPFAKQQGVFTIKIEPELDHTIEIAELGLVPTNPVQYNYSTVLVDLSPSVDDILMNLNQKARHAIRRAERDGVTIKRVPANDENCAIMYSLFQETAGGAGFAIRPAGYYKSFYRAYEKMGTGQLFFAYFEGKVVAGAFAMVQGTKSMYKDGASIRQRTAYGASHLLQWDVMTWAKEHGSLEHDLAGVPPIKDIKNPDHPFAGMARFKTSFNKDVTQYVGAFEVPIVVWKSKLWHRYLEKVVRKVYFMTKKESYY